MALDKATVARVADLARIKIPEADLAPLAEELNQIMSWIEQLEEVNTDGIAPMARVVSMTLPMRDDVVTDGGKLKEVLRNGPQATERYFSVPKVIE
jgi:aspartyl-tRNA(Asn)/glutamyl-tRNA(Gln) amidotransferase subunit C